MTTFYRAEEIQAMLDEFGVNVTFGMITSKGILDIADDQVMRGDGSIFTAKRFSLTVKTGVFLGLVEDMDIAVDGVMYRVTGTAQIDDGALITATLARAT